MLQIPSFKCCSCHHQTTDKHSHKFHPHKGFAAAFFALAPPPYTSSMSDPFPLTRSPAPLLLSPASPATPFPLIPSCELGLGVVSGGEDPLLVGGGLSLEEMSPSIKITWGCKRRIARIQKAWMAQNMMPIRPNPEAKVSQKNCTTYGGDGGEGGQLMGVSAHFDVQYVLCVGVLSRV